MDKKNCKPTIKPKSNPKPKPIAVKPAKKNYGARGK